MSKGAYYQGLVYANKGVKPVNFGALATGIAEQELTKRKDREEFELKIAENYGDVIYPAFDGTGLENADMYQRSVADLISARAEDLNDRFNNKEINKVQYTREMAKLKGQTQQLVSSFGKIEEFVKKVNELGGDADPKTLEMVEELELLFKNAKPYLDENNSLGNFSVDEEGKNVRSFLWSNVNKRLIAEKRYDVNTIPKLILGVQGDLSKFVADEKIKATLLDGSGNLKQEQTDLIVNLVKSMSNSELTSYAEQVLDKGEFSSLDITAVDGKKSLQDLVVTDLTDRTKNFLSQKTSTDQASYQDYSIKLRELAIREDKANDPKSRLYDRSHTKKENAEDYNYETDYSDYTFIKPKSIKGLTISGYQIPVARDNKVIESDPFVVGYRVTGDGRHFAKISYKTKTPIMRTLPNGVEMNTGDFELQEIASYFPITDKMEINQIRSLYRIPVLTDEELDSETKTNSNSLEGILD